MIMMRYSRIFVVALMLLRPEALLAHDFKIGLLVPQSGGEASFGEEIENAFRLAAAERDGHADEEADGHLGGLDVYILFVDTNKGRAASLAEVRTLLQKPGLNFISGKFPSTWMEEIGQTIKAEGVIKIDLDKIIRRYEETMDGDPLSDAYLRRFGKRPGLAASLGYSLARLLDKTVRITGDDFSDATKTTEALRRAGYR